MVEVMDRQQLIDEAVEEFAPHLAGHAGVRAIHLYSTSAPLRKMVRELAGGRMVVVEHSLGMGEGRANETLHSGATLPLPSLADFVATKQGLTSSVEWFAARLGAQAIVLPEGESYLRKVLERRGALILVGAEQAR